MAPLEFDGEVKLKPEETIAQRKITGTGLKILTPNKLPQEY